MLNQCMILEAKLLLCLCLSAKTMTDKRQGNGKQDDKDDNNGDDNWRPLTVYKNNTNNFLSGIN